MQKNHKDSTNDQISVVCKDYFPEVVKGFDEAVATGLITAHRKSKDACKLHTIIIDIMKAMDVLEACDNEIKITAKDEHKIPEFKSKNCPAYIYFGKN